MEHVDTGRQTHHASVNPFLQSVRNYYQSFLLHLLLGLSVTGLLLLSVIALNAHLPTAVQTLHSAVLLPQHPKSHRNPKAVLSQAVFEQSVYTLPGTANAYFPETHTTAKITERTTAYLMTEASLAIKDGTEPLGHPILDSAPIPVVSPSPSDNTDMPEDHIAIRAVDLSQSAQFSEDNSGILFSNQTGYTIRPQPYLSAVYPIDAPTLPVMSTKDRPSGPLVLILHTHGTEAYAPDGAESVPSDYPYRSDDITENVVSVGAVLARTLTDAGIPVLHCETMFDAASYPDSYNLAAAYIRETLAAHPSIQYVFDVHRDALQASDGSMLRPVTKIGEEVCAQVMSVVGTDSAGAYYPDWQKRLTVAVHLQKRLNDAYRAFARPINLRTATFNAQYAAGSLLLEIGAAGNSAEEARSAAYHLGVVLSKLILNP